MKGPAEVKLLDFMSSFRNDSLEDVNSEGQDIYYVS